MEIDISWKEHACPRIREDLIDNAVWRGTTGGSSGTFVDACGSECRLLFDALGAVVMNVFAAAHGFSIGPSSVRAFEA